MDNIETEIAEGRRFEFGKNWRQFLSLLDESRIHEAEKSLAEMLEMPDLSHKRFLDIGSGSGLFSLAARRLGASVKSFDYDPQSMACTAELKRRYFEDDPSWTVEQGSVLDRDYLASLGQYDVVYSWGVLHHTGQMWQALENVAPLVCDGGKLFIAIYSDEGGSSTRWRMVKRAYCALPGPLKFLVLWPAAASFWWPTMLRDLVKGRPFHTWRTFASRRGMSAWRDMVDWVGGYPYEVAKAEEIFYFYRDRGFTLRRLFTARLGCNEFVFEKRTA
jgi:2-polyprenyl-6-hydroxyphenyl methylase/3-demethylubiquinone-9 3-methyltransferase